jgi:hypothetical protein
VVIERKTVKDPMTKKAQKIVYASPMLHTGKA